MSGPFHHGELEAQWRAGVVAAGGGIRSAMPDQHRTFFEALPFMLAATLDADGAPRARVLWGAPGFVRSPDAQTLVIQGAEGFAPGQALGLLGLDFSTRRRNRANGVVRSSGAGGLVLEVRESFGNCPQHITVRDVRRAAVHDPGPRVAGLDAAARALIAGADTFFIATSGGAHGVDISHRGGPAGFVGLEDGVLSVPDYPGNRYFNTLGNLLVDGRAALLFIDFARGDVLEVQGRVEIDWRGEGAAQQRSWRLHCSAAAMAPGLLPLRWDSR